MSEASPRRWRGCGLAEALARLRARPAEALGMLARRRVPLGFASGAIVFWLATPTPRSLAAGAAVAAVGEAIRVWAAGHLNKAREVTASGPYRWLAHPLYVGSSIMGAGLAIACANAIATALTALYLIVVLTVAVRTEESMLRSKFGDRYDEYRRNGVVDDQRTFSIDRAVSNREHRTVAGLLIVLLLLAAKAIMAG